MIGSSALSASETALAKGRYDEAASQARKAARWSRWSPDPWRVLGDVQVLPGETTAAARESYRKAISKDRSDWKLWYDLYTVSTGDRGASAR